MTDLIERLRAENERLQYDGIHSCHAQCQRPMCVMRRENERLREALKPFAQAAEKGRDVYTIQPYVSYQDWSNARAALKEED